MSIKNESELLEKINSILKINEELLKKNSEQEKEIEFLKKKNNVNNVEVGCNAAMGVTLTSPSGDIEVSIKYGETVILSDEDVRNLIKKNSNRNLLSSGILYFIDDDNYSIFGINKKVDMNDDKIISIICSEDTNKIKSYFDSCTSKKFDANVMNTLFYKIVILNNSGSFGNISYDVRKLIETYFNMSIETASKLYSDVKNLI